MDFLFIKNKFSPPVLFLLLCLIFVSCNIDVNLRENENLTFNATIKTSASSELETSLRSILNMVHADSIFDEQAINDKLTQWGTRDIQVESPSLCTLNASFNTETLGDLLPKKNSLITQNNKTTIIKLDEFTVNHCLEMLPQESLTVIELLSAPIFTQENLGEEEYLQNISVLYGSNMAAFLANANINLSFESRSPIIEASSDLDGFAALTTSEKKVVFTIPLVKLLCLRKTLSLYITQK